MAKKITGPEILDQRFEYMKGKSVWYYIDILNAGLRTEKVDPDSNIEVTINYNINIDIIDQIKSFYLDAGWSDIKVTLTGNVESLYGTTIFKFIPPAENVAELKRKIIKLL